MLRFKYAAVLKLLKTSVFPRVIRTLREFAKVTSFIAFLSRYDDLQKYTASTFSEWAWEWRTEASVTSAFHEEVFRKLICKMNLILSSVPSHKVTEPF